MTINPILDPSVEGEATNMRRLWCAVILNAIVDAQAPDPVIPELGDKARSWALNKIREKREAIEWLTTPNRDFNEACSLAGLDPDATREHMQDALARPLRRTTELAPKARQQEPTLTLNGITRTLSEWARLTGISVPTLYARRQFGWPVERMLTELAHKAAHRQAEGPSDKQGPGWQATSKYLKGPAPPGTRKI